MSNRYISKLFNSGEEFEAFLDIVQNFVFSVLSGEKSVPKADVATKATQDANGADIPTTYAKIADLQNGMLNVPSVDKAALAVKAESIVTTNGGILKIFVGTQAEYDALTEAEQANVFAIITDDASKANIENSIKSLANNLNELKMGLADGSKVVAKATEATSALTATTATSAASATKATQDGSGNNIEDTYAKINKLRDGTLEVAVAEYAKYAYEAGTSAIAKKANGITLDKNADDACEIKNMFGNLSRSLTEDTLYFAVFKSSSTSKSFCWTGIFYMGTQTTQVCALGASTLKITKGTNTVTIAAPDDYKDSDISGLLTFHKLGGLS